MNHLFRKLSVVFSLMSVLVCNYSVAQETDPVMPDTGLKDVAVFYDLLIGVSTEDFYMTSDPQYVEVLTREFNMITPENALKWLSLRPAPDVFDSEAADIQIELAESYGMAIRGHALFWNNDLPTWLTNGSFTDAELENILKTHVQTVVSNYRGRIFAWDVISDPLAEDGELAPNLFLDAIGPDYIAKMIIWAHEADPDALLFISVGGADKVNEKSDALYEFVQNLLEENIPLNGVALQMHASILESTEFFVTPIDQNMTRFGELGLVIHVSEMDVSDVYENDESDLRRQAVLYDRIFTTCLRNEYCQAFSMWGLNDSHSWLRRSDNPNAQTLSPLLFDGQYARKPAYWAIFDRMFSELP